MGDPGRDTGQGPRAASPPWSSTGREQRGAGTSLWPARPCPRASRQRTAPVKFPGPATPPAVGKFPWLRGPGLSRLASRGADTAAGPGRVSAGARDAGRPGWARAPIPRTKGPAPAGPGSRARGASEVQVGQSRPLAPGPDAPPGPRLLAQNPTWTPAPARTAARNPVQIDPGRRQRPAPSQQVLPVLCSVYLWTRDSAGHRGLSEPSAQHAGPMATEFLSTWSRPQVRPWCVGL